ncbi:MAG: DUF3108 domain-containing protein [Burkholderiaceae bacterium]|nr:DUF3108 domain-containing protein [Burkholderiaceae bacterium]
MPWRVLGTLGAVVLAAHLLLLDGIVPPASAPAPTLTGPLVTRMIVPPPQAAVAPPPPAARPRPVPRPRPAVAPTVQPAAADAGAALPSMAAASAPEAPAAGAVAAAAPEPQATAPAPEAASAPRTPEPAAVSAPPAAAELAGVAVPGSRRLSYSVTGQQGVQPMSGVNAELEWRHDGARYEARLAFSLLFRTLRSQTSTGTIGAGGLAPERFSDRRRTEVAAHFERAAGRISYSANTPSIPLMAGAQDRLSVFFQLAGWLAGQTTPPAAGTRIDIQTTGPRDADVWEWRVDAPETLRLPAGEFDTLKLVRAPRPGTYEQRVEAWFAPSLDWLPVRLRVTDANGDVADQRLRASEAP